MEIKKFYSLIDGLNSIKKEQQIAEICTSFCELVGMPYYFISVFSKASVYAPVIDTITNLPEQWIKDYVGASFQKIGPTVAYMFHDHRPVRWDRFIYDRLFQEAEHEKLIEFAHGRGLTHGFSMPLSSLSSEFAIYSMATGDKESSVGRMDLVMPFAHMYGTHLFQRYVTLLRENDTAPFKLTERERECMFWACEGKTTWEISRIVEISERTVIYHLHNSTQKLGASNRQHAVAIAIEKGLITQNRMPV